MSEEKKALLRGMIVDFVETSSANSFGGGFDEKAWDEALIGFASGADPLYESYKEFVGSLHWTPAEIFNLTFPDAAARPEDLVVISWVLAQRKATRADNRREDFYPSARWVQARFAGEDFNDALRRRVTAELEREWIPAVAPAISPHFEWVKSPRFGYASRWSERHSAYAAGLGTFGLCDGLITRKGKAHRVGSVVARMSIRGDERPYADRHAYCLFFHDGSCMKCAKRCPVGAITEHGHNKDVCWDHAGGTCAQYVKENFGMEGYGCGLCQTAVPCESGIPPKLLRQATPAKAPARPSS